GRLQISTFFAPVGPRTPWASVLLLQRRDVCSAMLAVHQSLPNSRCVPTAEGALLACVSRMLRVCASPNTSTCLPSCGSSLVHCGSSLPSSWLCLLPSSPYRWRCITPRKSRLCLRREFSLFFACFSWSWPPFALSQDGACSSYSLGAAPLLW